jgi:hypothetical protein
MLIITGTLSNVEETMKSSWRGGFDGYMLQ